MQNNTIEISDIGTDVTRIKLSIVTDEDDCLWVPLSAGETENLILNLSFRLALMKGYTPDMFDAPGII